MSVGQVGTSAPAFTFDHGAVSVPDLDASIDWYRSELGFEVVRRFDLPSGVARAAVMIRDGMRFELFQPLEPVALPEARRHPDTDVRLHGNKHVGFRVDDIAAFARWFEERGADIAHRVSAPFGSAIFIRDNAGNLIEFIERASYPKP